MTRVPGSRRAYATLVAGVALLACSDDDPTGLVGTLAVAVSPATIGFVPGTSGTVAVTVGRTGTVGSPVALTIGGVPAGVTTTITPSQLAATESNATVNLAVGSGAALGDFVGTVTATAPNIAPVSASFQLLITVPVVRRP